MTSRPLAKGSRRERFGDALRRGYERVIHTIRLPSRPVSQHPGDTAALSTNAMPASSTLPTTCSPQTAASATRYSLAQGANTFQRSAPEITSASAAPSTAHVTPGASPSPTTVDRFKEAGNIALSGLETALRVLEKSSDAFPPLKSAVGGFIACLDIVQSASANVEDYERLTSELTAMAGSLDGYTSELELNDPNGSVRHIAQSIEAEVKRIEKLQGRGRGRRMVESAQDKEDIIKSYHKIEGLFRQLQNDISVRTWKNTNKLPLLHTMVLLQGISPVDEARYNSTYSTTIKRRGCTTQTRQKVQSDLQDWSRDPNGAKVYWMNGMAGTGKTTIAYSLCAWLETNQRLGASFFCSRGSSSCRNVNWIIPTIAYQLALSSPAFQSALCSALEADPGIGKLNVVQQFEKLVRELISMCGTAIPAGIVVIIDALDECEDDYGVRLILGTLLKLSVNLPLKFFVTSRPEPAIRDNMQSPTGYSPAVLHLHDIEQSIVEEDIRKYLVEALGSMSPPPSDSQIEQLAKHAGKLFIYAATVARYITSGKGNPIARLNAMLITNSGPAENRSPSKRYKELDRLYTAILVSALADEDLEAEETEAMQIVLWTVVCIKEPMTIPTLAPFTNLAEERVSAALKPLHSVLHVSGESGLVSTLHASFPDYMFDQRRSGNLHCNQAQHSKLLARRCFDVMKEQLKFNICNLESSFVFDKDVSDLDQKIKTNIPHILFYACHYWGDHLQIADISESDEPCQQLADFLSLRLLFWMEVLNLKRCIANGISILAHGESWLSTTTAVVETQKQAADARDFVTRFAASTCNRSTPHIYISALPFCAKSNSVYLHYWGRTQGLMDVRGTAMSQRERAAQATWATGSEVLSVAFSPDGTRIASGSYDKTIRVWNARTGDVVAGPFEGHTDWVYSVAFSPDGTRIVSGPGDKTIRVWDARTGDVITGPLIGHTNKVKSAGFSPDGTRIVSGSDDRTIRLWDANTGGVAAGPFMGHTDSVCSVGFYPDGINIVSGSDDSTILVWNACTGNIVVGPFIGHKDSVHSLEISPDGAKIVSGSEDRTIRVWDARTGKNVAGPFTGHSAAILSVGFSLDGKRIVSGSEDRTIRIWDARTGDIAAGPFIGHAFWVRSVAFSPDGAHIVSGSYDQTIRTWVARTADVAAGLPTGHKRPIWSVGFSPDGARVASGSDDCTIRVWDARTGSVVAEPFEGHTRSVNSIAFSPDGSRIASGSKDGTILVWDASTGNIVAGPFTGHTSWIWSVAFSPNGMNVVSGSEDSTLRVWDTRTRDVVGPLTGHTGSVLSVAFSFDGSRVVSGSGDRTILVWDAFTGGAVAGPFKGHTDLVWSVVFSLDSTRVFSGSKDNTIRVWDACTGSAIAEPWTQHTDSVCSLGLSPDGRFIVSGSSDHTIRLWCANTGSVVAGPFTGHAHAVRSVGFSPDGARIVSSSHDPAIRVLRLQIDSSGAVPQLWPHRPIITPSDRQNTSDFDGGPGALSAAPRNTPGAGAPYRSSGNGDSPSNYLQAQR